MDTLIIIINVVPIWSVLCCLRRWFLIVLLWYVWLSISFLILFDLMPFLRRYWEVVIYVLGVEWVEDLSRRNSLHVIISLIIIKIDNLHQWWKVLFLLYLYYSIITLIDNMINLNRNVVLFLLWLLLLISENMTEFIIVMLFNGIEVLLGIFEYLVFIKRLLLV